MKHTPGPWTYVKDTCAQCEADGEAEFYIPEIGGGYHAQFSSEADARLIAASPELLDALREADLAISATLQDRWEALQYQLRKGPHRIDKITRIGRHLGRFGNALIATRAAIAKAEGRS